MKPLLLPTILMLLWVLRHNIHKNNGNDKENISSLLKRESSANSTRRQDISKLNYIQIPMAMFPFDITLNDEKMQLKIADYQKEIISLSEKKMLNLIGKSNTELKELYGPANLQTLSVYDQNYSRYIRTIHMLAECIYDEHTEEAVKLLEYCISIGTDISGTYELLGRYYLEKQDVEHFRGLYDSIPDKSSISGKMIQHKLNDLNQ